MTIVLAILKKFWPCILGGAVVLGLLFTIWIKDKKIDSLGKDVKICHAELEKATSALTQEKFAFDTIEEQLKACDAEQEEGQKSYKALYEQCMKSNSEALDVCRGLAKDQAECICEPGECPNVSHSFDAHNKMVEGW